jgi:hypothetical protein
MRRPRQNETEGTRGNSVLHKKGVEETPHVEQPPCTCTMAKCVHAADGQWTANEEGGRGGEREKQAEQTRLRGEAGRGAHPSTQQKQGIPPPPPPALHITQLRSREEDA